MAVSAAARRSALLALPALLALMMLGAVHETAAQCTCANVFESYCTPSGCGCPAGQGYTNGFIGCGPTPGSAWRVPSCMSSYGGDTILAVAVSPDGNYAVAGTQMGMVGLKHVGNSNCVATAMTGTGIVSIAIASDGKKMYTGDYNSARTIRVWHNGTTTTKLSGHTDYVNALAVVPGNKKLVSVGSSQDKTVRVWDLTSNSLLATMTGHTNAITAVAVSPDGTKAATCGFDKTILIWDLTTYKRLATLTTTQSTLSIAYHPDGKRLVTGTLGSVDIWDLATQKVVKTMTGHLGLVNTIAVSKNGKYAVSGCSSSSDNSIRFWSLVTYKAVYRYTAPKVQSVAISPNSLVAVAGSGGQLIRFAVNPETGVGSWRATGPL